MHREKDHGEGVNVSIKSLRWPGTKQEKKIGDTSTYMVSFLSVVQRCCCFLIYFPSPANGSVSDWPRATTRQSNVNRSRLFIPGKNFRNCLMFRAKQKYEERKAKRTLRISGISFEKEGELF